MEQLQTCKAQAQSEEEIQDLNVERGKDSSEVQTTEVEGQKSKSENELGKVKNDVVWRADVPQNKSPATSKAINWKEQYDILRDHPRAFYLCQAGNYRKTNIVNWYERLEQYTIPMKYVPVSLAFLTYLREKNALVNLRKQDPIPNGIDNDESAAVAYSSSVCDGYYFEPEEEDDSSEREGDSSEESEEDSATTSIESDHDYAKIQTGAACESETIGHSDFKKEEETAEALPSLTSPSNVISIDPFPDLVQWITETIKELGGRAFTKLSWRSPRDANWMLLNRSVCCYVPGDVYTLLQFSDEVSSMLENMHRGCLYEQLPISSVCDRMAGYSLILKKWVDIAPETEFRCFVMSDMLVGISQRDTKNAYPVIEETRDSIILDIYSFFVKIHKLVKMDYYVFDVIRVEHNVTLVDINPFNVKTDPCLFKYDELQRTFDENLMGKCFEGSGEISRSQKDKLPGADKYGQPEFRFIDERAAGKNPFLPHTTL